jgi:exonuclease III
MSSTKIRIDVFILTDTMPPSQISHSLKIFHQNIRGSGNKDNKPYCHLHHDLPHILCLSEHHLSESKLQLIHLTNYSLGANYCRKNFLKGGVSICVYRNLKYKTLNICEYNTDKVTEACGIQLDSTFNKLCILALYRSPSGDFTIFLKRLDLILQKLYNNKCNIFTCGDVNVNYLTNNNHNSQRDTVFHSYNLAGIVEFPTRYGLFSQTAIDNVFIDTSIIGKHEFYPLINGLADHDAQLLILNTGQKK